MLRTAIPPPVWLGAPPQRATCG